VAFAQLGAHIGKRHLRVWSSGHGRVWDLGTTAGAAMALPTVTVRRVLGELVAYGLATRQMEALILPPARAE
jgi:hypothetical protein